MRIGHNHRPQINQLHREGETQSANRHMTTTTHTFADLEGDGAQGKSQNIEFLSSQKEKLQSYQASIQILGHHRHVNETPLKWRFVGGQMMGCVLWYVDSLID